MIPPLLHIIFLSFLLVMLWGWPPYPGWEKYDPVSLGREKGMGAGLRFDCWVGDLLAVLHCATFMTAFKSPSIASWLELLALPKDVGLTWHGAYTFLAVAIDDHFLLSTLTDVLQ